MADKVIVSIALDRQNDRDILTWLERQENRSAAIRQALREHIGHGISLADVYMAIRDLERKLQSGVIVAPSADAPSDDADVDEPPDVAAALEALAKM